jgi:hypothetical protein
MAIGAGLVKGIPEIVIFPPEMPDLAFKMDIKIPEKVLPIRSRLCIVICGYKCRGYAAGIIYIILITLSI